MTPRRPSDHDLLHGASGVDGVRALCHDLRQPLAAILLLSESGVGDPERRLATIRDEARWLATMIDDVLVEAPVGRAVGCILDNAIRAAGPHGSVTVEVREDGGHVQVVVEDDGPGLGKVPAHTSMGLTITAALVSASGGEFTLTPRPGGAPGALARIV